MNYLLVHTIISVCPIATGQIESYSTNNDSTVYFLPVCEEYINEIQCINEINKIISILDTASYRNNTKFVTHFFLHICINRKNEMKCFKIQSNVEINNYNDIILEINKHLSIMKHSYKEQCRFIIPLKLEYKHIDNGKCNAITVPIKFNIPIRLDIQ